MINQHACRKTPTRRNNKRTEHSPAGEPDAIAKNLRETAAEMEEWNATTKGSFSDMMSDWAVPQYLVIAREELKTLTDNTARLQRAEYHSARLEFDRERLELEKEKFRLLTAPAILKKRKDVFAPLTDEERHAIISKVDEIMGIKPCYPKKPSGSRPDNEAETSSSPTESISIQSPVPPESGQATPSAPARSTPAHGENQPKTAAPSIRHSSFVIRHSTNPPSAPCRPSHFRLGGRPRSLRSRLQSLVQHVFRCRTVQL